MYPNYPNQIPRGPRGSGPPPNTNFSAFPQALTSYTPTPYYGPTQGIPQDPRRVYQQPYPSSIPTQDYAQHSDFQQQQPFPGFTRQRADSRASIYSNVSANSPPNYEDYGGEDYSGSQRPFWSGHGGETPCADPVCAGPLDEPTASRQRSPQEEAVASPSGKRPKIGSYPGEDRPELSQGPSIKGEQEMANPGGRNKSRRRAGASHGIGQERSRTTKQGARGRETEEYYTLNPIPDEVSEPVKYADPDAVPCYTLTDEEYKDVFQQLNDRFCKTSYNWLARYKFQIPVNKSMKEHRTPEDRELTEYVMIIKDLVENRKIPFAAVRDDRIKELKSIMEGASEIRHVTIHVSRKQKPDRRVIGFIAAVAEYCHILGDRRGTVETNTLYARIQKISEERKHLSRGSGSGTPASALASRESPKSSRP